MNVRDLFKIEGKIALVTGGAVGLGAQIAAGLAEAGVHVALAARKVERCRETAERIRKDTGVKTMALRCDVSNPQEVKDMTAAVLNDFGRIDILVNNSGTNWGAPAVDYPLKGWNKVIDVNLSGTFFCCQEAGRAMIAQGGGRIINVASVAGMRGFEPEKMDAVAYPASKAAVINLTRDLAAKWARFNINVNAIAPGWFPTDMTSWTMEDHRDLILKSIPMRRLGKDYELKGAVVFLASEASGFVTGHTLVVDGGESVI
jgi:NAD(P)-dependent dehydrogenase (short-subunit alcohol dehydrogenase family)